MTEGYAYGHAWSMERVRLAGLETALDPGTREHLTRLGVGPGKRCLEIGAGGGSVAFWLAERVAPGGTVVATDLETDFLESAAVGHAGLQVLRHDVTAEELPTGFDLVHARWLVEWLPDKRSALRRMMAALRPGGVLLIEEPDFTTIYSADEPPAVGRVFVAAMRYLESTCPVSCVYGRRALSDLVAVGLVDVEAEGRCPIVRGGSPLAADFLRLTLEKLRGPVLAGGVVTLAEFDAAVAALQDPGTTVVAPMTVAAWGKAALSPMADADDVRRLALSLPHVVEIDSDGFDFRVADKGFVWSYPERRPGKPRVIRTDIAVLFVGDEAEKQALLLGEPEVFFTAPGYDGWPLVILRLAEIDVERLRELVTDAWRMRAPQALVGDLDLYRQGRERGGDGADRDGSRPGR